MNHLKKCKICLNEKTIEEFHKNKNTFDGRVSWCKSCYKVKARKYYLSNKERIKTRTLDYQRNNPEKRYSYTLKRRYRVSKEEYEQLLSKQNGVCAICKTFNLTKGTTRLCLDHCHKTNKVRGLLCDNCNKGLGHFKDNTETILQAHDYLKGA